MTAPSSSTPALTGSALAQFLHSLQPHLTDAPSRLQARLAAQPLHPDTLETIAHLSALWLAAGNREQALAVVARHGQQLLARLPSGAENIISLHQELIRLCLDLGDDVIDEAPDLYAALAQPVTAFAAPLPLPQRREAGIRLARLQARANYASGDLSGALALRNLTICNLSAHGHGTDDFLEYDLPWLVEAGRLEDAGERAFHWLRHRLPGVTRFLATLLNERLADPADVSVWWPLCVMVIALASSYDTFCRYFGTDSEALRRKSPVHARIFAPLAGERSLTPALFGKVLEAAGQLAEERAPRTPWILHVLASYRHDAQGISIADARPDFEAAVTAGIGDATTLTRCFQARVAALGLEAALREPALIPESAAAAYSFAAAADDNTEDADGGVAQWLEGLADNDRSRIEALWTPILCNLYDQGIARMEHFFATGEPQHPDDACADLYSMMCHSYATKCCNSLHRYDDALELHHKGMAASPFAEHYFGIFQCRKSMVEEAAKRGTGDDAMRPLWEKAVAAGEDLWQFSIDNGFSRNEANNYIPAIAEYLHSLQRDAELPGWLERLVLSQEDVDGDIENPAHLSDEAIRARLKVLAQMHRSHRDEARKAWAALKPQVRKSKDWNTQALAGNSLWKDFGEPVEAIEFFKKHLRLNPQRNPDERNQAEDISKSLSVCWSAPGARAWWQVWR